MASGIYTDGECSVCLEELRRPVVVRCGHAFCRECYLSLKSHKRSAVGIRCPLCRAIIKVNRPRPYSGVRAEAPAPSVSTSTLPFVLATLSQTRVPNPDGPAELPPQIESHITWIITQDEEDESESAESGPGVQTTLEIDETTLMAINALLQVEAGGRNSAPLQLEFAQTEEG